MNGITTISVTQSMIDQGKANSCNLCPVALAMRAAVKEGVGISVVFEYAYLDDAGTGVRLPANAVRFILDFDRGAAVKPFAFQVEIPAELVWTA